MKSLRRVHPTADRSVRHGAALLCAIAVGISMLATAPASATDPFLRRTPTVRAVEKVGPTVVNIMTQRAYQGSSPYRTPTGDPRFESFFRDFFEPRRQRREALQNLGSGVIIDSERHVLTNEHVIAGASLIRVSLADGREFEATLVGADPNNDLAVLQLQTDEPLPWTDLGNSEDLMVGEPVIAIGNPFGFSHTVTTGVISALDRSLTVGDHVYHGFLQTDASINPGNSGGPLLNANGALIAINTAIYQGAQGIGFAVPVRVAERVIAELLEHGEIQPVWLGIDFQNLDPALQEVMDLPEGVFGALVNNVQEGSPAGRAGVRRGDIVLKVDGYKIQNARVFFQTLEAVIAGQTLELEVWRNGGSRKIEILATQIPNEIIDAMAYDKLGVELEEQQLGGFGVTKVRRGSPADQIGFKKGDLILGINGRPLDSDENLRRALLDLRGVFRALVVVQRNGRRYHVPVTLL